MVPSLADLRRHPRDRDQLLVYADWLLASGSAHGEVIMLMDLASRCASEAEFRAARGRSRALLEGSADTQVMPTLPDGARGVWASWDRGFVRRLELLVDRPSPGPGFAPGPTGWAELLDGILTQPCAALLEHVLVRFDLRGEPLDETAVALDMATRGFARWRTVAGARPPLQLDLWSGRTPGFGRRERLTSALAELRPYWFSTDITVIPPPHGSPAFAFEADLRDLASILGSEPFELDALWFDARGHFLGRVAASTVPELGLDYEPAWQVHVRRLAELRPQRVLAPEDPLALRRITALFDDLCPRFDAGGFAPAGVPSVDALSLAEAVDYLHASGPLGTLGEVALRRFTAVRGWYGVERPSGGAEGRWRGVVGLGDDEVVVLGAQE